MRRFSILFRRSVAVTMSVAPSLTLVTKGAQSIVVGSFPEPVELPNSPLWGLGKTIALEHPELRCTRIDLDPQGMAENTEFLLQGIPPLIREDQLPNG